MDAYENLAKKLKENEHIPRARRIRKNLSAIEEVLISGVTIDYLVSRLNEYGFLIKFDTFKSELYRERKRFKKAQDHKTGELNKVTPKDKTENQQQENVQPLKKAVKQATTKDIKEETDRYNEEHEIKKAEKEKEQRDKKLLEMINKQNKGK